MSRVYCSDCNHNKPGYVWCGVFAWGGSLYTNMDEHCKGFVKATWWKKFKYFLYVMFNMHIDKGFNLIEKGECKCLGKTKKQ